MAGNSSTYLRRENAAQDNLNQWAAWAEQIDYVVSQFIPVIDSLNTKIENIENSLEALMAKVNTEGDYVKLSSEYVEVTSTEGLIYSQKIGVFSNHDAIYVYSESEIPGLFLNNIPVTASSKTEPLFTLNGAQEGTFCTIKTDHVNKIGNTAITFGFVNSDGNNVETTLTIKFKFAKIAINKIDPLSPSNLAKIPNRFIKYSEIIDKLNDQVNNAGVAVNAFSTKQSVANNSRITARK